MFNLFLVKNVLIEFFKTLQSLRPMCNLPTVPGTRSDDIKGPLLAFCWLEFGTVNVGQQK